MRWFIVIWACLALWLPDPSRAESREPFLTPDVVRSELRALYEGLQSAHFDLFAHRNEESYRAYLNQLMASVDRPMSHQDVAILLQQLTAYGQVGHARIDAPLQGFMAGLAGGGRFLPLFVRVDGDRTILAHAGDLDGRFSAGDELVELNGEDAGSWLERLRAHVSAESPYFAHAQMEESFPVLLSFALGDVESVSVTVRKPTGEVLTGDLHAVTLDQLGQIRSARPTPEPVTDFSARAFELLPHGIGYLRPGPFAEAVGGAEPNYDSDAFAAFIDQSFEQLIAAEATDLVIDLRNNPGGDNSFSDLMVAWFADRPFRFASSFTLRASVQSKAWYEARVDQVRDDSTLRALADAEAAQPNGARYAYDLPLNQPRSDPRFEGAVHVLVNRHSYSNAASVAAMIQDYGFGEIMGEETADVPTTYASVLTFVLPATGIVVTYPKSRIVRPSGDESLRGVTPDVLLARPQIGEAEDVVLAQAIASILSRRGP